MAQIKGAGNKGTELRLIGILRKHGITGWRRGSSLMGRPDFVFSKLKLAVFVDGCFWHDCPKHGSRPRGNAKFWREKFRRNKSRDRLVTKCLRDGGWRVLRIWEHALVSKQVKRTLGRIRRAMADRNSHGEN
jgi:DNA mismatch endonuclease (patch repair protein)